MNRANKAGVSNNNINKKNCVTDIANATSTTKIYGVSKMNISNGQNTNKASNSNVSTNIC